MKSNHKSLVISIIMVAICTFCMFYAQCIESSIIQNNLNHHKNLKHQDRILQSSWLGFDLSAFSSGSLGNNFQSSSQTTSIASTPVKPSPVIITATQQKTNSSSSQTLPSHPVINNKISNKQFAGITLYHEVPTAFLYNQIYTFKGSVNAVASKINIIMSSSLGDNTKITVSQDLNGKSQFQVPVRMNIIGRFYMTIFTGSSGAASGTIYQIKETLNNRVFNSQAPKAVDQLSIYEKQNKVYVKWNNLNGDLYPVVRLTFQQYSTRSKIQFYYSNFQNEVQIPVKQFASFQKSTVSLVAVQAKSSSTSSVSIISQFSIPKMIFFNAEKHCYSQIRSDLVSFNSFPFTYNIGDNLSINGKTNTKLKNQVVVLEPSNNFKSYLINDILANTAQIPVGYNINLNIDISQQGVYIIEINHKDGFAVLNRPVYIGNNIIPLLPDSQDLKQNNLSPSQIASQQPRTLSQQRELMLKLINQKRQEFGLEPITLDQKLNKLAQQHSEDMVRRKFNSHYTPQGLGPTDRALNSGIYEQIGQNIGVNSNITDAHYRLSRSNIHLRNIVNQKWVRVGLGFKLNSNNSFVITQQFSTRDLSKQPISQSQFDNLKNQIVSFVIFTNRVIRSQNIDLSNKISAWHLNNYNTKSVNLSNFIGTFGYSRYSGVVIRVSYNSQSLDVVKAQQSLLPRNNLYTQMGISVKFNSGFLQVYVGYVA